MNLSVNLESCRMMMFVDNVIESHFDLDKLSL